uniref:hypothetical protein n=1 Tax=Candidatus Ventrenecus sp. TaxID=3085654 RepID=UPI003FF02436
MDKICQKILVFLCLFIVGVSNASAASTCDYETQVKLNSEAANIKASYEVKEIKTGKKIEADLGDEEYIDETYQGVEVSIYNMTENLYLTVMNTSTNETKTYHYEDTDNGSIKLVRGEDGLEDIVTYQITIYSNHNDCKDEELKKINLVTPKYNSFSADALCEGSSKYYCQEYVTEDLNMTYDDFLKQAANNNKNDGNGDTDTVKDNDFFKKYGIYIVGGILVILLGVMTTVIVRKKQRSSVK